MTKAELVELASWLTDDSDVHGLLARQFDVGNSSIAQPVFDPEKLAVRFNSFMNSSCSESSKPNRWFKTLLTYSDSGRTLPP